MAKKRRIFYPESEQILGLFTTGKEWMFRDSQKEYKGPYHRFTDGIVMTGASPMGKRSKYLMPYKEVSEESVKATEYYRLVTTIKVDKFKAPQYYYPILTPNDISVGYVERYFVQKKSNPTAYGVTEVDKKQFDNVSLVNKPAINGKTHHKFSLRWKLLGTKKEIEDTNRKTLLNLDQTYKGILQYLSILTEFSKFSPIISE